MFRFKMGIALGYLLGWMVASGKAAELLEQFKERRGTGAVGGSTAWSSEPADTGVYDLSTSRLAT